MKLFHFMIIFSPIFLPLPLPYSYCFSSSFSLNSFIFQFIFSFSFLIFSFVLSFFAYRSWIRLKSKSFLIFMRFFHSIQNKIFIDFQTKKNNLEKKKIVKYRKINTWRIFQKSNEINKNIKNGLKTKKKNHINLTIWYIPKRYCRTCTQGPLR